MNVYYRISDRIETGPQHYVRTILKIGKRSVRERKKYLVLSGLESGNGARLLITVTPHVWSNMTLIKIHNVKGNQVHQSGRVRSVEKRVRQVGLSANYTVIAACFVSNGGHLKTSLFQVRGRQRQCLHLDQCSSNEQRHDG